MHLGHLRSLLVLLLLLPLCCLLCCLFRRGLLGGPLLGDLPEAIHPGTARRRGRKGKEGELGEAGVNLELPSRNTGELAK